MTVAPQRPGTGSIRVAGAFDPPGLATRLAGSGLFDCSVVYEQAGSWWVAGGRIGSVELYGDRVRSRWDGRPPVTVPLRDRHPVAALAAALDAGAVPRWRAYGWLAFEAALVAAGHPVPRPDQRLGHLVVPLVEVRVRPGTVDVRSDDPCLLDAVVDLAGTPGPDPAAIPRPVPVDAGDPGPYLRAVDAAVERIHRRELEKVILSRRVAVPFEVDFAATYLLGRSAHTPARSFLVDLPGLRAAGFSPETVAEVTPDGWVTTQPLAGTRRRTGDPGVDDAARAELTADPKEIHEHAVSVKLADSEMRTVCTGSTVAIHDYMSVKRRGSVLHLGSEVSGRLRPGLTGWDALAALFPAVTASGIPKAAAYDAIADHESGPRGLYSGTVLRATHDGAMDATLALRTVYTQDGRTWLRAGAGVVAASVPSREYRETCEKLASVAPHLVPYRAAAPGDSDG